MLPLSGELPGISRLFDSSYAFSEAGKGFFVFIPHGSTVYETAVIRLLVNYTLPL
jgi:hypothetical protein